MFSENIHSNKGLSTSTHVFRLFMSVHMTIQMLTLSKTFLTHITGEYLAGVNVLAIHLDDNFLLCLLSNVHRSNNTGTQMASLK